MKIKRFLIISLCLGVILLFPVITNNPFWSFFLGKVLSSILLTVAAWSLLQVAGQPVFGLSALAGIGAYGFALSAKFWNVNPWFAIIMGMFFAMLVGFFLSVPSIKIGGVMNQGILNIFFISAFAALIAAFSKFSGGTAGVPLVSLPPSYIFKELPFRYLIVLIFTFVSVITIYAILESRLGKIFSLITQNECLASTLAINTVRYKRIAYLIFVPFFALAGFCDAYIVGYTSPAYWSTNLAFITILSFWIGGVGNIFGPIVGAALITSIPTLFNLAMEYRFVICGILGLLVRIYLPEGIMGFISSKAEHK